MRAYIVGFLLSIALTLVSYFLVVEHLLSGWALDLSIATFAIGQACVQLVLFFNLTQETKPRWNLITFLFMIMVVVLIVFGSLWIMENLNYNLMS